MKKLIFLIFGFFPSFVLAHYEGYVVDGYVFHNNYWWKNGYSYSRVYQPYTYFDGCYYRQSYRWVYTQYSAPKLQTYEKDSSYEGWRKDLLKIASQQLKRDNDRIESQQEQKEFLEAVKALGLDTRFRANTSYPSNLSGASVSYGMGGYNGAYSLQGNFETYSQKGQTVYGYDSGGNSYNPVDLQVLFNQANRLAETAQGMASRSTEDFSALVSQESSNQIEVEKIKAKALAAERFLRSLAESEKTQTKTEILVKPDIPNPSPSQNRVDGIPPDVSFTEEDERKLAAIIQNNCLECHNSETLKGGLNMENYFSFDNLTRRKVIEKLVEQNESKRMPPLPNKRLSIPEISLFYRSITFEGKE